MPQALSVGAKAPDFLLPRAGGGTLSLADFKGKPLVLYFYPKADTSGCTQEAKEFSERAAAFKKAGVAVLGVSADPVKRLDTFKAKYDLDLMLAGDEEHAMLNAYGVWAEKSMYGRKYMGVLRNTFLIGPDGTVAKVWEKVKVPGHAEDVLAAAKVL